MNTNREANRNAIENLSLIEVRVLLRSHSGVRVMVECQKGDDYHEYNRWVFDVITDSIEHRPTLAEARKKPQRRGQRDGLCSRA
jgi:hypothetical protein